MKKNQDRDLMKKIEKEVQPQINRANEVLDLQIMKVFPEIAYSINQKNANYYVLLKLINFTEEQRAAGMLEERFAKIVL